MLEKEGTKTGSETGSGEDSDLDITDNDIIQIQFGPTDNCITWTVSMVTRCTCVVTRCTCVVTRCTRKL